MAGRTRWAVYVRISDARERDGEVGTIGVERQEQACRERVAQLGGQVAEVYRDNNKSAWSGKRRPAYERMLDDIKAGKVDAVIVWHEDRLTRRPAELEHFADVCLVAGMHRLVSCFGEVNLSNADDMMVLRIKGAVSRNQSDAASRRIRRALDVMASNGQHKGGPRPFGFEPDGVTIRETEAEVTREAARRVLAGESLGRVVADLKARGVRTAQGAAFHTTTMRRLLVSPRVAGLREHHGEIIGQAAWDAILDETSWNALRGLFSDRSGRQAAGRPAAYVFSGLLACGLCGGRMIGDSRGAKAKGYGCVDCGRIWISAAPVERELTGRVIGTLASRSFREAARRRLEAEAGGVDVARLDAERAELADYRQMPARFMTAQHEARMGELEASIAAAERQMADLPAASGLLEVIDRLERTKVDLAEGSDDLKGLAAYMTRLMNGWLGLPVELKRIAAEASIGMTEVGPTLANRRDVLGRLSPWACCDGDAEQAASILATMLR